MNDMQSLLLSASEVSRTRHTNVNTPDLRQAV